MMTKGSIILISIVSFSIHISSENTHKSEAVLFQNASSQLGCDA